MKETLGFMFPVFLLVPCSKCSEMFPLVGREKEKMELEARYVHKDSRNPLSSSSVLTYFLRDISCFAPPRCLGISDL